MVISIDDLMYHTGNKEELYELLTLKGKPKLSTNSSIVYRLAFPSTNKVLSDSVHSGYPRRKQEVLFAGRDRDDSNTKAAWTLRWSYPEDGKGSHWCTYVSTWRSVQEENLRRTWLPDYDNQHDWQEVLQRGSGRSRSQQVEVQCCSKAKLDRDWAPLVLVASTKSVLLE